MDDKWFTFFEEPYLYLHRSWTGHCIYHVRFERRGDAWYVIEALANRDADQYRESDDQRDTTFLEFLLCSLAGRDAEDLWEKYVAMR